MNDTARTRLNQLGATLVALAVALSVFGAVGTVAALDGLTVDQQPDVTTVNPGDTVQFTTTVGVDDSVISTTATGVEVDLPDGWTIVSQTPGDTTRGPDGWLWFDPNGLSGTTTITYTVQVPSDELPDGTDSEDHTVTAIATVTGEGQTTDQDTITVQQATQPTPANFAVSNLNAPGTATQGALIDVSATVENTGDQSATKAVEFRVDTDGDGMIADESAVASTDVQLDSGESTTVEFTDVDTSGLPVGTLTHGIATPDDVATAQISITEQPVDPDKETTMSLEPADQQIAGDGTATYDVVVDSAEGGVGAGELRVEIDDTNVATITDLQVGGGASVDETVTDSYAEFDYYGANTQDTGSVVIATVTVEAATAGDGTLSIEPAAGNSEVLLFNESGDGYEVTDTSDASLEVSPPAVPGAQGPPNDPDGDGLYEDVNGDGSVDVGDPQALFANREAPEIQNYVAQYDFNDDGVVNVGDAQALFDMVING